MKKQVFSLIVTCIVLSPALSAQNSPDKPTDFWVSGGFGTSLGSAADFGICKSYKLSIHKHQRPVYTIGVYQATEALAIMTVPRFEEDIHFLIGKYIPIDEYGIVTFSGGPAITYTGYQEYAGQAHFDHYYQWNVPLKNQTLGFVGDIDYVFLKWKYGAVGTNLRFNLNQQRSYTSFMLSLKVGLMR